MKSRRRVNSTVRRFPDFMRSVFLIVIATFAANAVRAQGTPDVCRVTGSVWNRIEKRLTGGPDNYGDFRAVSAITHKSFTNKESNLTIDAQIEYGAFNSSGKPTEIRLTLEVFDKQQKAVASFDDRASATTTYGRLWGKLTVVKDVTVGDNVYTFGLTCEQRNRTRKAARSH
jgi:hypothetical protein